MSETASRTINPLHFEDLEPRRFEDLVRQLAYDFRSWRRLEATGRAGSDDGFDARGWEIASDASLASDDDDAPGEEARSADRVSGEDRLWLIQCKRERQIGPTKLRRYLDDSPEEERRRLYGVLLAAPCDFSKKSRDEFRVWCRDHGIAEWHLWGRAEIEDRLFRPANDHLLFAYFGISLQIRRRSMKTEVRARLATKRAALKHLDNYQQVMLRDPSDDRYPNLDEGTLRDRSKRGRWRVVQVEQVRHDGVHFVARESTAYLAEDGRAWDYPELSSPDRPGWQNDPTITSADRDEGVREEQDARRRWSALPAERRGHLRVVCILPFEAILAIDEDGDDIFEGPHIFTTEWLDGDPPYGGASAELNAGAQQVWNPDFADRVRIFRWSGDPWDQDTDIEPEQGAHPPGG